MRTFKQPCRFLNRTTFHLNKDHKSLFHRLKKWVIGNFSKTKKRTLITIIITLKDWLSWRQIFRNQYQNPRSNTTNNWLTDPSPITTLSLQCHKKINLLWSRWALKHVSHYRAMDWQIDDPCSNRPRNLLTSTTLPRPLPLLISQHNLLLELVVV